MPFCNECGKEVLINARFCNHCGIDRQRELPTLPGKADKEPEKGTFCPVCGKRSSDTSLYCMWCGHGLSKRPDDEKLYCPACCSRNNAEAKFCKSCGFNLIEHFDEEVNEKLRVNLQESREYLSKYESWLWQITRFFLESYANFDSDGNAFTLRKNPFPNEKIHPGPYKEKKILKMQIYTE